jgi:hypothetical protein
MAHRTEHRRAQNSGCRQPALAVQLSLQTVVSNPALSGPRPLRGSNKIQILLTSSTIKAKSQTLGNIFIINQIIKSFGRLVSLARHQLTRTHATKEKEMCFKRT